MTILALRRAALLSASALGLFAVASINTATAADLPVKAPVKAVYDGGYYVWVDGSAQWVALPTFDLGMKATTPANFSDLPAASFDPRATGDGVSGGVGYLLPNGSPLAWFGTRTRVELAGSYVNATASQNAASLYPGFALVTVTATESQGAACGAPRCRVTSRTGRSAPGWPATIALAASPSLRG